MAGKKLPIFPILFWGCYIYNRHQSTIQESRIMSTTESKPARPLFIIITGAAMVVLVSWLTWLLGDMAPQPGPTPTVQTLTLRVQDQRGQPLGKVQATLALNAQQVPLTSQSDDNGVVLFQVPNTSSVDTGLIRLEAQDCQPLERYVTLQAQALPLTLQM